MIRLVQNIFHIRNSWQKPYESLMGKSQLQVLDAVLRTPEDEQREGNTEYRYYVIADGNLLNGLGTTTEWDKKGNPRPSTSYFAQREYLHVQNRNAQQDYH